VVAAVPLPLGTRLDASNTRLIHGLRTQSGGMFTRVEDVTSPAIIHRWHKTKPVLEGKLAAKESGAGLSATIPEGMRGLSVAVNEVVVWPGSSFLELWLTCSSPGE